jgi:hypothetical protein
MNNTKGDLQRRIRLGGMLMAAGALLLAVSLLLPLLLPGSMINFRWVGGFGILFLGWGGIYFSRHLMARRNPETARRLLAEERDERNVAIRHRAGYYAFLFYFLSSGFALVIYSAMTRGQDVNGLWVYMALMTILPPVFYVGYLFWLEKQ